MLDSVARVIAEVAPAVAGAAPAVVAGTDQGDGCWLVDERGHSVRPAVSWMDGRAAASCPPGRRTSPSTLSTRSTGTCCSLAAGEHPAPAEDHEPQTLDRAATAAYCKDVIVQRLTRLRATDPSDATLPFGSPAGQGYAAEAVSCVGCSTVRRCWLRCGGRCRARRCALPEPPAPGFQKASRSWPGPFDLPACAVGAGVRRLGGGLLSIGTTLACEVLTGRLDLSGEVAGMHLQPRCPAGGCVRYPRWAGAPRWTGRCGCSARPTSGPAAPSS